jgi:hypothetical protein
MSMMTRSDKAEEVLEALISCPDCHTVPCFCSMSAFKTYYDEQLLQRLLPRLILAQFANKSR